MLGLGPAELVIILLIVLLIFGGSQLPKLARSLGQASKEFKTGTEQGADAADESGASDGDSKSAEGDSKSADGDSKKQ